MSMVEPVNCWDTIPSGIPKDEEYDDILNILDFPMESLEDDGFVADWDISESDCLGPIPTNVLMGPPTAPNVKVEIGVPSLSTEVVFPITGAQDKKRSSNLASGSRTLESNKSTEPEVPISGIFQTQSPVSVLESSGSCSAITKNLPTNSPNTIPVRARTKRLKRPGPSPWLSASSYFTTTSKRASIPRKDKDKRKKPSDEVGRRSSQVLNYPEQQNLRPAFAKKCTHCEVTKTPQWREGPLGPKTLCNACGVRYRSGRLFPEYRPAVSPTFVPTLHSNSHKKVIEMRNKGKRPVMKTEEPVSSPQPEFVPMSNYLFDYIY